MSNEPMLLVMPKIMSSMSFKRFFPEILITPDLNYISTAVFHIVIESYDNFLHVDINAQKYTPLLRDRLSFVKY